ncbi:MAG: hypothetical protein KDC84_01095 [Crocinitomicaceae bacterium]|nr:hypothetical protein [Crocinitomicaceae bacterium]
MNRKNSFDYDLSDRESALFDVIIYCEIEVDHPFKKVLEDLFKQTGPFPAIAVSSTAYSLTSRMKPLEIRRLRQELKSTFDVLYNSLSKSDQKKKAMVSVIHPDGSRFNIFRPIEVNVENLTLKN